MPIYSFRDGLKESYMLLGLKGAGLARMTAMNLPVPQGFIITTEICEKFFDAGMLLPDGLMSEVKRAIRNLELQVGLLFGDRIKPLLVSVRSGSSISMPGIMTTILNVGLNDDTVDGLASQKKSDSFAWDCYRRFVQMLTQSVLDIDENVVSRICGEVKAQDVEGFKKVVRSLKEVWKIKTGKTFPEDPYRQLELSISTVLKSWSSRQAIDYRKYRDIPFERANGTAVVIMRMVFGNLGDNSMTGIAFTRSPETGDKKLYGEYLINAQGEDLFSGCSKPSQIEEMASNFPTIDTKLRDVTKILEEQLKTPQQIEFTVEENDLYLLQTRPAEMSAFANVKASVDLCHEGLIDKTTALSRIDATALEQMIYPSIDLEVDAKPIALGIGASPGSASGIAVFDLLKAKEMGSKGEQIILVRDEVRPEDAYVFIHSAGLLTLRGGKTSHAIVVARGMGKPCVVGCSQIFKGLEGQNHSFKSQYVINEGQNITIDGTTGKVYLGEIRSTSSKISKELTELLQWAHTEKKIEIRANADTPDDASLARHHGAEGVGLCRTENMFNEQNIANSFKRMILTDDPNQRKMMLLELNIHQKIIIRNILMQTKNLPVAFRLLDAPLHEFLPREEDIMSDIDETSSPDAKYSSQNKERMLLRVRELKESNPMLGHRGVRIGISYPELYEAQINAICEASAELKLNGITVFPQILVPQVSMIEELKAIKSVFENVKRAIESKYKFGLRIEFGCMIEAVRSCLIADKISACVDFISFGTNDLTQATFSFSREDAESKFLTAYMEQKIITFNPFQTIDKEGVGTLMRFATERAKRTNKKIKIGICGEHGGDPNSIKFFSDLGLDYVSTSPRRIPIAILSAAQSSIKSKLDSSTI
jgi:pyruvate,orthophosphate dikinase